MPELKLIHGEKNTAPTTIIGSSFILRSDILWPVYSQRTSHITWLAAGTRLKIQYISDLFIYLDIVHSYDSIAHVTVDAFKECLAQNKLAEYCVSRYMVCLDGGKAEDETIGVRVIRRNLRANQEKQRLLKEKKARLLRKC